MSEFLTILTTGITSFVATNIDDIVILMLFFAQVNQKFRPRHIIIGQYIGFTILILASMPGFLGGLIIPKTWIGLLGLLPIIIGIKQLFIQSEEETTVQAVTPQSAFGATNFLPSQIYQVVSVTVANGGDNIGIYVPLFASLNWISLSIILGVFYLLIGVWCLMAYGLTRHPIFAKVLTQYGSIITPFVLIGLGIFILIESETYHLFS